MAGLVIPLTVGACAKTTASEQAARQFMEAYYVRMDLKGSKVLTEGLAQQKVASQMRLLDGKSSAQLARLPSIRYELVSSQVVGEDEVKYIFEVRPQVKELMKRRIFLKLRRVQGQWRVTQFVESFPK